MPRKRRARRYRPAAGYATPLTETLPPDRFGVRRDEIERAPEPEGHAGFYVYCLVDPRTSLPFYVGKGQRDRAWQHEKQFRSGKLTSNPRKCAKIAEIVAAGFGVEVKVVRRFKSEVDALDLEYVMVEESPTLTNIQVGGCGLSPAALERRARRRKEIYLKKRAALIERRYEKHRQELHTARGAEHHREEIDAWVDAVKRGDIRAPMPRSSRSRSWQRGLAPFRVQL